METSTRNIFSQASELDRQPENKFKPGGMGIRTKSNKGKKGVRNEVKFP